MDTGGAGGSCPPSFFTLCSKSRNLLSKLYKWPPRFFGPWPPRFFNLSMPLKYLYNNALVSPSVCANSAISQPISNLSTSTDSPWPRDSKKKLIEPDWSTNKKVFSISMFFTFLVCLSVRTSVCHTWFVCPSEHLSVTLGLFVHLSVCHTIRLSHIGHLQLPKGEGNAAEGGDLRVPVIYLHV